MRRTPDGPGGRLSPGSPGWLPRPTVSIVLVALLAVFIPLALAGSGSARAANPELTFSLSCSPEQTVGGAVAFKYTLTNTGDEALTKVSVIDDRLGNISIHFPASLNPTESFEIIRYYIVQESDPRPFTNGATATYDPAAPVSDDCTVDVPHLSLTKTAEVIDTSTTYTFILTNDGSTWLHRMFVTDSFLGDITDQFPLLLAPGESAKVEITVLTVEPCENTVWAQYESVPRSLIVFVQAECGEAGGPDFVASKECSPKTGDVGDPINVEVSVLNIGTDPLSNVTAVDDHAGSLAFSGGDDGNGLLDPGETWMFTGSYNPGIAGSFTNQAEVQATAPDGTVIIRLTNTDTCAREKPPGDEGCTPGFWRNHLEAWGPTGFNPGDDFDTTFGVDLFNPNITLEQAVNLGGGGVKKLARHGTAALLSAAHPGVDYPFSVAEVIALVQAGDVNPLVAANELGCSIDS